MPLRSDDRTPFAKCFERKPNLHHLKECSCWAWVHVLDTKCGNFDSKTRKLMFIGYAEQHRAYRFVSLETKKVTISNDAKFLERGEKEKAVPQTEIALESTDDEVTTTGCRYGIQCR